MELVFILGIAVSVATAIGAAPVIHLMYGSAYDNAVPVMVILAFCIPFMYLGIVFGQVLVAAGRPTVLTIFLVVGGLVNAGLNVVLVPLFQHHHGNGAIGSAISLLVTEVLITVAGFVVVGRHVLDRASWSRALRTFLATAAMFVVAFLLRDLGIFALPVVGLTLSRPRVVLRVPTDGERAALANAARAWPSPASRHGRIRPH